jgi:hypothetical protein
MANPTELHALAAHASSAPSGVYYLSGKTRRIGLRLLQLAPQAAHSPRAGRDLQVAGREDASRLSALVTDAARAKFEMLDYGIESRWRSSTS